MDHQDHVHKQTFPLRMPISLREEANKRATEDNISLNHFICLAITEKLSRMQQHEQDVRIQQEVQAKTANNTPPQPTLIPRRRFT